MKVSDAQIARTARSEGFSAHAYDDHGGRSIGYGHRILPGENFPDGVTQIEATVLLNQDLQKVAQAATPMVPSRCTQSQFDALCDFGFNLGIGALKTMLGHGWQSVPEQILRWDHAGGVVSKGLLERREQELSIWNAPSEQPPPNVP